MSNRNAFVVFGVVAGLILLAVLVITLIQWGTVNTALGYEQNAITQKSNVTVEEKRRKDLIPKMVQVVEKEAEFEKGLLTEVTKMRSEMESGNIENVSLMLKAVHEAYPTLQTNQEYSNLNKELAVTENRLADNRKAYNQTVNDYQRFVRGRPTNSILVGAGYEIKDLKPIEYTEAQTEMPEDLFSK